MAGRGQAKQSDFETAYEVLSFDANITLEEYSRLPKNPLYIILDNLRSAFNVGSIFRLCDALRVSGLFLCGYTAHPPHLKLNKTSLGTAEYVPWKWFPTTIEAVNYCKTLGVPVWAAETTTRSKPFQLATYPAKLGLVFGNEALGINRDVLDICDEFVQIPLFGFKNSINVATSCAVLGFHVIDTMATIKKATTHIE